MIEISKRSEERTAMRFDKVMSLGKELFKNNLIENIIKYMYVDNKPWNEFYHNSHHLMAVILKSNELAKAIHMSDEEKKLLFVAAMFHDYDHSYGYSNDYINVCTSVNAFNKKLKNNREELDINCDDSDYKNVKKIVMRCESSPERDDFLNCDNCGSLILVGVLHSYIQEIEHYLSDGENLHIKHLSNDDCYRIHELIQCADYPELIEKLKLKIIEQND